MTPFQPIVPAPLQGEVDRPAGVGGTPPRPSRRVSLRRLTRTLLGLRPPVATPPSDRWISERVVADFDTYVAELERDIAAARRLVMLEVYIFGDDPIGRRIEDALAAAAARGVQVLLAVDGVGSSAWIERRASEVSRRGIQVRVYHPPPWQVLRFSVPTRQRLAVAGSWMRYINRRNHRKVCLIDGALAWVGSMNLVREHSCALQGERAWRDVAARVEGEGVRLMVRAFIAAWRRAWRVLGPRFHPSFSLKSLHLPQSPNGLVRLNHGLRMRRIYYRDLLSRIRHARRRVWIANAYFVPQGSLLEALADAAAGGADVRVVVPAHSDVWFMPFVAATFADHLARAGVRLYQYQPCMLHAKTMLVDGWASVGSTNLNNRSLRHDLEADVVLTSQASLAEMERIFAADIARSLEITGGTNRPPWWVLLIGSAMLLLRRWI
jgi:cardiolipin synthase